MLIATYTYQKFHFKRPSGTSRGTLTVKESWFISLHHSESPAIKGIGECSVIPGLSPDFTSRQQYEHQLDAIIDAVNTCAALDEIYQIQGIEQFPSILFGLETAYLDLQNGGKGIYFHNDFSTGQRKIPINGLIWMGDKEFLLAQLKDKLNEGFSTIKMKIGAIDFVTELDVLQTLRSSYDDTQITLRVDANGAFTRDEVEQVLKALRTLKVHSIEQPIRAGQIEGMADLCAQNIIPIALDEELIGISSLPEKEQLLRQIKPQFIILKPSLHGGIKGTKEWIEVAEKQNIQWWLTSALESNIGLAAICQFCAEYNNPLPQGLGTGALYTDNIPSNLVVEKGFIFNRVD